MIHRITTAMLRVIHRNTTAMLIAVATLHIVWSSAYGCVQEYGTIAESAVSFLCWRAEASVANARRFALFPPAAGKRAQKATAHKHIPTF
jgi:hypothetical protein